MPDKAFSLDNERKHVHGEKVPWFLKKTASSMVLSQSWFLLHQMAQKPSPMALKVPLVNQLNAVLTTDPCQCAH